MKNLKNLGKLLGKSEQKEVLGGDFEYPKSKKTGQPGGPGLGNGPDGPECISNADCCDYYHNTSIGHICSSGICAPGLSDDPFCDL